MFSPVNSDRLAGKHAAPAKAIAVRPLRAEDSAAVLALNAGDVALLSPLDKSRWQLLQSLAAHGRAIDQGGDLRAFLLAFREGSTYDSPNYQWFAARYERFLYIDRVVVAPGARGAGLGRALYDDAFATARRDAVPWVVCEFDLDPPNDASAQFHQRLGFVSVGTQWLATSGKRVSLQAAAGAGVSVEARDAYRPTTR